MTGPVVAASARLTRLQTTPSHMSVSKAPALRRV